MKYLILTFALLSFSFWLMFHTFSYDQTSHRLLIASKAYSDFGSHIPQIRSFSLGANWPPEYPLFPGEKTRYHFLFYAFVGLLEKAGLNIDYALNIPSSLGFFFLTVLIFIFVTKAFSSQIVGFLSVIFFLFNGSFSFLDFYQKYPDSLKNFASFGPWNGSLISAFWSLNIYTNQRHLGLSYAVTLLIVLILQQKIRRYYYYVGFLTGSLLLLNQAAFSIVAIFLFWFFIFNSHDRIPIVISGLGFIPWFILTRLLVNISPLISFVPGYLIPDSLTVFSFIRYWFLNLGFHFLLIPVGIYLAPKKLKTLAFPLLTIFIMANLWQFSPDMINNHKFFNFIIIIAASFSALSIVRIWSFGLIGKIISPLIVLSFILGGVTDFFPVKNDYFISIPDYAANPDADFVLYHTPARSVFLNSFWFYHPASLAGRSVFNGYSYFTWSYGYDQVDRENITAKIYAAPDKYSACSLLLKYHISYVELSPGKLDFIHPNYQLWHSGFTPVYQNPYTNLKFYSVSSDCSGL